MLPLEIRHHQKINANDAITIIKANSLHFDNHGGLYYEGVQCRLGDVPRLAKFDRCQTKNASCLHTIAHHQCR